MMGTFLALFLTAVFLSTGLAKLLLPMERIVPLLQWAKHVPQPALRLLGGVQIMGGAGIAVDRFSVFDSIPASLQTAAVFAVPGMGIMMALAVLVHLLIRDPFWYALPAFVLLVCLVLLQVGI